MACCFRDRGDFVADDRGDTIEAVDHLLGVALCCGRVEESASECCFRGRKVPLDGFAEGVGVGLTCCETELPCLRLGDARLRLEEVLILLLLHALLDGGSERGTSRQTDDSDTQQRTGDRAGGGCEVADGVGETGQEVAASLIASASAAVTSLPIQVVQVTLRGLQILAEAVTQLDVVQRTSSLPCAGTDLLDPSCSVAGLVEESVVHDDVINGLVCALRVAFQFLDALRGLLRLPVQLAADLYSLCCFSCAGCCAGDVLEAVADPLCGLP